MPKELSAKEKQKQQERIELEKFLFEVEDYVKNPSKYRKDEMPDFRKPFTEEEKKAYEDEYIKAIDAFNKGFEDYNKIIPDIDGLYKRLNDPNQVEIYRRSKYVIEKINQKNELFEKYKEELYKERGFLYNNRSPISSSIAMLMRTDGSIESENFNKKLLLLNKENPIEFGQAVLKGLYKADSTVYEGIIKDDYERSKVYTDNFEHSLIAQNIDDILNKMDNDKNLVSELANSSISELLKIQEELGAGFDDPEFMFVMPKLSEEQINDYMIHHDKSANQYFFKIQTSSALHKKEDNIKVAKFMKDYGYLNEKEPLLSYKTVGNGDKEVSVSYALNINAISLLKREDNEKAMILQITNGIRERGLANFKNAFVESYNEKVENINVFSYDQDKILDNHKGGFFERLFNTTSKEYKDFTQNFKNFTDLNSPDFGDKEKLYASAKAYIDHKNVKNDHDIEKLDHTGRERVKFCQAVIEALGVSNIDLIDDELNKVGKLDNNHEKIKVEGLLKDVDIEKNDINKKIDNNTKEKTNIIEVDIPRK